MWPYRLKTLLRCSFHIDTVVMPFFTLSCLPIATPSSPSVLFFRSRSRQRAASKRSHVGPEAIWRDAVQQPGESTVCVFTLSFSLLRPISLTFIHCALCSICSSNWPKWPPSWWRLVCWCVRLPRRCRRTGPTPFLFAPWRSSLPPRSVLT